MLMMTIALFKYYCFVLEWFSSSQRKRTTFRHHRFSLEIKSEERGQKFHSDDVQYADLGSTSDLLCRVGIWPQPIRSIIQT